MKQLKPGKVIAIGKGEFRWCLETWLYYRKGEYYGRKRERERKWRGNTGTWKNARDRVDLWASQELVDSVDQHVWVWPLHLKTWFGQKMKKNIKGLIMLFFFNGCKYFFKKLLEVSFCQKKILKFKVTAWSSYGEIEVWDMIAGYYEIRGRASLWASCISNVCVMFYVVAPKT